MSSKILRLLKVYDEEISLLLWTIALLFIIRSAGVILNNYAETTFLKRYGVEYLPVVNMLNAVATSFIIGALTVFMGKISGARLLSYVFVFSGISITLIRQLIPLGIDVLYPILFMLKSQLELLHTLLFWNMCNDLFNTRQSKRLFPLLTAGGLIGLILGSVGTPYFAKTFKLDNLLYIYLATCLIGFVFVHAMNQSYSTLLSPQKPLKPGKEKSSMLQQFKDVYPLVKDSLLIKIVLVLTFMPNVVIPIMNYQFNYAINDQFSSEATMIQFFGYFRGGLNAVSLFILLFVGRIYERWGLPVALMFHPFNYMIAFFAFLFRFDVFSAAYARMSTTIIRTTINLPANNILIGLFPESYRNMIRPFMRGTVVRIALFAGSSLILFSEPLFHPKYLTLVALPFVLAWMAAPIILKSKYALILRDLISKDLLDIKSLDTKELRQVFKQDKILLDLETSFLAARENDAIWYGKLLKKLFPEKLDSLILQNLSEQSQETQALLTKMLSPEIQALSAKELFKFLDPQKPEMTITILTIICQHKIGGIQETDLTPYLDNTNPMVRGSACACLYSVNPGFYGPMMKAWLKSPQKDQRQSGIISAGLSQDQEYVGPLLAILSERNNDPLIPDIIIALVRLRAKTLNKVISPYLSHSKQEIRTAALNALEINDALSMKKAILFLGEIDDTVHDLAKEKILEAPYQNHKVLVESLGLPNSKVRRGLFDLLETLDIKEFDVLMFAKENLSKCYTYLAMGENLNQLPQGRIKDLAIEHLFQQKERVLENIIRVLAIHDATGRMKTAWRGIFSTDTRQKANSIELLSDILDRKTFNAMLPLLESPTPALALAEGKNLVKLPTLDSGCKAVFSGLLASEDWVDVLMSLSLIHEFPSLYEDSEILNEMKNSTNKILSKETQMIFNKSKETTADTQSIRSTTISTGEKILLLKGIEIFSGLGPSELAAIAAVTEELDYAEDTTVIKQNDAGDTLFLIIRGRVQVIIEEQEGKEVLLDYIETGGAFGEMSLLDDNPRSATIRTVEPCQFLILHKQEFKEIAMEYPRVTLQICAVLSQRIRNIEAKFQLK
jgi:hypothetical protein